MPTLNWLGKDKIINHANKIPFHVLNHKYNFQAKINSLFENSEINTGNKIIHGDNLIALKSLLPEYAGKIKCVYIDPPYNTGNENWVYNDNVNDPKFKKWLGEVVGKEGEDLTRHDKWLCMMYPRLQLLKQLLSDDGAIFISIDDNEQANLKLLCDEIFGGNNFVAQVIWERAYAPVNLKKHFSLSHDYLICYAKNIEMLVCNGLPRSESANDRYKNPDNDPRGLWQSDNLSVGPIIESKVYEITTPSGRKVLPPKGYCWRLDQETFQAYVADNRIWFGEDGNNVPRIKRFLSEVKQGITPMTIWKYTDVGHSQDATKALKTIFDGQAVFSYPKPVDLIKRCLELYTDKNSIILDSFAGSGTTAHAVLNLNKLDNGKRKFILIELEDYADNITAERVKRVMQGYNNVEGTGGSFDFYEVGEAVI
ncbi:MAG: site-specific DNA-methyltransferase, partial [Synergistaceae bacterium]|nr:site-specific DNA-methyltransferase [Synergistaceae bacterium]